MKPEDLLTPNQLAALAACPQDPTWHGEGDVLTHTRMVCDELEADLARFPSKYPPEKEVLRYAAVLHDIAKPKTTRVEDGRIRSPSHSTRGAIMARVLLWERGVDFPTREQVAALVRMHQVPYHFLDKADPTRIVIQASMVAGIDLLCTLSRADIKGRICRDKKNLLDGIQLFSDYAAEIGINPYKPFPFYNAESRFLYFNQGGPHTAHRPSIAQHELILLSGFPGAGKSTLAQTLEAPIVSLDKLREDETTEKAVINAATEAVKVHLRRKDSVVLDATNLVRRTRKRWIELARNYGAKVRIIILDKSKETILQQNKNREHPVPEGVLHRMIANWEAPDLTEAHALDLITDNGYSTLTTFGRQPKPLPL